LKRPLVGDILRSAVRKRRREVMDWILFMIGFLLGLAMFHNLPMAVLSGVFFGWFLFGNDEGEMSWGWFAIGFLMGWVLLNSVLLGIFLGLVFGLLIFGR
jgi:hypothetical protein